MPTVSIQDSPVYYEELGGKKSSKRRQKGRGEDQEEERWNDDENNTGKSLVFVHGACENLQFWGNQRSLADNFRLIMLDLPGHGKSKPLAGGEITVRKYAQIVAEFIEKTCPEKKTILVGHSMGGAIALIDVVERPDLLKGAVFVSTGAKLGVLPSIREGLRTRFEDTVKLVLSPKQFASTTNLEVIRFVTNEMLKCKGEIASADFEACNGFDIRQKLGTISLPTLIVAGEEDRIAPVTWSTYMNTYIPKSRLVILKESSHLPMLERPADFNRYLSEFATSLPS